jgi:hypothetical protein
LYGGHWCWLLDCCPFLCFHAFLFANILNHGEEQQFIRRLRYFISNIPHNAVQKSFMFIEKGCGIASDFGRIILDYQAMGGMHAAEGMLANSVGVVIDQTQARVIAKRQESRVKHVELWET